MCNSEILVSKMFHKNSSFIFMLPVKIWAKLSLSFNNQFNFVTQVVEGNIPWHRVVYGGPFDNMLKSSQDPVYRKIWTDKKALKRTELSESMLGVYNGNNIVIDWKHGLEQFLAKYSTPSGDPLIHISNTPYMRVYIMGISKA